MCFSKKTVNTNLPKNVFFFDLSALRIFLAYGYCVCQKKTVTLQSLLCAHARALYYIMK